jgi:hypothetical protein
MKGGVRGKYARRVRKGTNVVLIEPEIAKASPTEAAVNEALRGVLNTTRAVRDSGGLADEALGRAGQGEAAPRGAVSRKSRRIA